jgi:hypothetical protein
MSQGYEEWLAIHRRRDENVISGEKAVERIRQKIRRKIIEYFKETEGQRWCQCDTCILIRLKAEDEKIISSLAYVGLEYLLGENFNAAAAGYYYSYAKGLEKNE